MTAPAEALPTPGLARRIAAFVYEGVILFGVVVFAGLIYAGVTQQRHALQGQTGLQVFVFGVLAAYFVVFWTRGGQTVAMRAWHVRLVTVAGRPLTVGRALARFLLAWLWFVPALVAAQVGGLRSPSAVFALLGCGALAYALLAFLHPDRQFFHDALCGTRLVTWRPARREARAQSAR